MNLWLANPRGFCAGVERAVKMVDELLAVSQAPVYVRHEIVHNRSVVSGLRQRGAVFVDEVAQIPPGALAVVSAHGAPPQVFADAGKRELRLFDATCPLVSKVHLEVIAHSLAGHAVLLIGHRGHVEVDGTLGQYTNRAGGGIQVVQDEDEARVVYWPIVPSTSTWPRWPISNTAWPASECAITSRCTLLTNGQVASNNRNSRLPASANTWGGAPWALTTANAPGGICATSSTKMAPRMRRPLTTLRLCTISWRT